MSKKIISFALKLVVTVGLFVLLFRPETYGLRPDLFGGVTPVTLWHELQSAQLSNLFLWLGFAIVVKLSGMLAGVIRWQLLLRGQGLHIPFWYMLQSWFVGRMFGIFVPGTIGLDGYRLYDSALYTREPLKSATVIAVEKLIGFISLTFLVFLTFPLGFRLFKINAAVLAITLAALGIFVVVSFLLLLNPRVIQVLVEVVPTPAGIRNKVNKLGAAITAYSGRRPLLLLAVVCGLWVHLATCFMYFGTMMALRAPNTSLLDILFASPIMIYGTVIGPSVGGEGIREIVFAMLLGAKSGVGAAVLFSHLGWWVDNVIPFLIGLPIFVLRSRPSKAKVQTELAAARAQTAAESTVGHLAPGIATEYRNQLLNCVLAGVGAGLIAGACVGLAEAAWLKTTLAELTELSAFWWGPLVYGLLFAGVGFGAACALAFLYLLVDRFAPAWVTFGLAFGASMMAGAGIGVWRYMRDVLARHAPSAEQVIGFAAIAAGVALLAMLVAAAISAVFPRCRVKAAAVTLLLYVCAILGGAGYAILNPPAPRVVAFHPSVQAAGPNIILIVADALRADYLKLYSPSAVAETPNLDAFARDAVVFDHWFSQASWTKPSFATIFSGLYPTSHTATGQVSALPADVATFPEILTASGYFTKGFANNPNIFSVFNFGKGYVDYTDLKPRLYFGATYSASKLALYEVLRRVRYFVATKLTHKLVITDFYHPAEMVTQHAIEWLDSGQHPPNAPFFLFLHYMDTHDPFMDHTKPGVGYARVGNKNPEVTLLEPMRDAYLTDIEYLDQHVGELLAGLRQRGLYDNAVILFTSDHGEEFQDHHGWWHGQTLFDELIHVPMLVKLPGQQKAGERNSDFGRHIDVGPTLLHFAGATPAPAMPGKSLIDDAGAFVNQDIRFIYAENDFENNIMQAVRTQSAKAIRANPDNPRNRAPLECYDLANDPSEQNNLAGQSAECPELDTLIEGMIAFTKGQAGEPAKPGALSAEERDQLKGLGYLGNQ